MALKRTLEFIAGDNVDSSRNVSHCLSNDDHEPPSKRRMLSIPYTPQALPGKVLPHSPSTCTPYPPRPSDSPSNPFGRKRTRVLTRSLPPPTSFSKHLPLRFQFIRRGLSPRLGGVYRIVQVPLSYTFVQLRCLILFLFGAGYGDEQEDRHLFEVKKKMTMYSLTYKPGQIKSGFTTVKLSTACDPCRYRPEIDEDALIFDDDTVAKQSGDDLEVTTGEAEEGDGWTWEAEEDYTLGHAWSRGGDLDRGITYHHNTTTAVHITVNTTPIPRRRGVSNIPYVFQARGRVRLLPPSPPPLPRPVFSVLTNKLPIPAVDRKTQSRRTSSPVSKPSPKNVQDTSDDSDGEGGDASSCGLWLGGNDTEGDEWEEDIKEEKEDLNVVLETTGYNAPNVFSTYLRLVSQRSQLWKFPQSDTSDSDDSDDGSHGTTPGLVHGPPSSSPTSSSVFPSSPASVESNISFPYEQNQMSALSSLSMSAFTPAPPHALWQRLRLERVQKRMDKLKKKRWMCTEDESEGEEVDELGDRAPEDEGAEEVYVKPVLKPGEVWDPFGDEVEV